AAPEKKTEDWQEAPACAVAGAAADLEAKLAGDAFSEHALPGDFDVGGEELDVRSADPTAVVHTAEEHVGVQARTYCERVFFVAKGNKALADTAAERRKNQVHSREPLQQPTALLVRAKRSLSAHAGGEPQDQVKSPAQVVGLGDRNGPGRERLI